MWGILAGLVALESYTVRELLAALFLFALAFAVLTGPALLFFLVARAGAFSRMWAEPWAGALMSKCTLGFRAATFPGPGGPARRES